MKCSNCGFISSKEFYRCPYCGTIHEVKDNALQRSIKIGNIFTVRLITIIYLIVGNLFAASILIDWFLNFQYGIVLWSFILLFGPGVVISILASRKKTMISSVVKIDLFLLVVLILGCGTCRINGLFDLRIYIPTYVIPAFTILGTFLSVFLLFRRKNDSKIRPLWTEVLLFFHLTIAFILFVFFLFNKYWIMGGLSNPPFRFYQLAANGNAGLYMLEEILVYAAFGLAALFIVNYNIILVAHVLRQVRGYYGKPRD